MKLDINEECYDLGSALSSKILGVGGIFETSGLFHYLQSFLDSSFEGEIQMKHPSHSRTDLKSSECVWKGAALLSDMPCNDSNWVSKTDFQEDPNILFRKFKFKL